MRPQYDSVVDGAATGLRLPVPRLSSHLLLLISAPFIDLPAYQRLFVHRQPQRTGATALLWVQISSVACLSRLPTGRGEFLQILQTLARAHPAIAAQCAECGSCWVLAPAMSDLRHACSIVNPGHSSIRSVQTLRSGHPNKLSSGDSGHAPPSALLQLHLRGLRHPCASDSPALPSQQSALCSTCRRLEQAMWHRDSGLLAATTTTQNSWAVCTSAAVSLRSSAAGPAAFASG